MNDCGKDCLILIPFRLPQISCFPLSLKCFSSGSIAPCGDWTPASVPPSAEGTSSPTNTPVFPPSSFILPSFAWVYIFFPLARYSCPLSAGVVHALLCLKVYSWCIRGERCTPCPPTPPPSCFHFCILCFHFYLSLSIFNFPHNFFFDPLVV